MQNSLPEVGKTYTSKADPSITAYVEAVHLDDDEETLLTVETCDPAHKDNMGAIGTEYDAEEWRDHLFTIVAHR